VLEETQKNQKLFKVDDYPNTFVDVLGNVYNDKLEKREPFILGGYPCLSLFNKQNKRKTVRVHQIVARTLVPNDDKTRFYVNHIDSDKENSAVDNLDWVTPCENNIHAMLMDYDTYKKKLVIYKDGVPVIAVKGLKEASTYLNIDYKVIWDAIKNKKVLNEHTFLYLERNDNLPKELRTYKPNVGLKKKISIMDIDTREVTVFNSLADAAKYLDVYVSAIYQAIHVEGFKLPKLVKQRYMVQYEGLDFPVWTEDQIRQAKNRGAKMAYTYNVRTKERKIYPTAEDFIKQNNMPRSITTKIFGKGKLREVNDFYFVYFEDTPEFRKIEDQILELAGHERSFYGIIDKQQSRFA